MKKYKSLNESFTRAKSYYKNLLNEQDPTPQPDECSSPETFAQMTPDVQTWLCSTCNTDQASTSLGAMIDWCPCCPSYDPVEIPGCPNPNAINYTPGANVDNGSCIEFLPFAGCPDDPIANLENFIDHYFGTPNQYQEVGGSGMPYIPNVSAFSDMCEMSPDGGDLWGGEIEGNVPGAQAHYIAACECVGTLSNAGTGDWTGGGNVDANPIPLNQVGSFDPQGGSNISGGGTSSTKPTKPTKDTKKSVAKKKQKLSERIGDNKIPIKDRPVSKGFPGQCCDGGPNCISVTFSSASDDCSTLGYDDCSHQDCQGQVGGPDGPLGIDDLIHTFDDGEMVECTTCMDGSPVGNMFPINPGCPHGWIPASHNVDPCESDISSPCGPDAFTVNGSCAGSASIVSNWAGPAGPSNFLQNMQNGFDQFGCPFLDGRLQNHQSQLANNVFFGPNNPQGYANPGPLWVAQKQAKVDWLQCIITSCCGNTGGPGPGMPVGHTMG